MSTKKMKLLFENWRGYLEEDQYIDEGSEDFAALAPPYDKATYADKIAGATGRTKAMGGGLMEATERLKRQGLRGGGLCKRGMNREAIGKNS